MNNKLENEKAYNRGLEGKPERDGEPARNGNNSERDQNLASRKDELKPPMRPAFLIHNPNAV